MVCYRTVVALAVAGGAVVAASQMSRAGDVYTDRDAFNAAVAGLTRSWSDDFEDRTSSDPNMPFIPAGQPTVIGGGAAEIATPPGAAPFFTPFPLNTGICWFDFNGGSGETIQGRGGRSLGVSAIAFDYWSEREGMYNFHVCGGVDSAPLMPAETPLFIGWVGAPGETLTFVDFTPGDSSHALDNIVTYVAGSGPTKPSPTAHIKRVPCEYITIQAAVDAAVPGDTILISSGTYAPFTVTKNDLTLRAEESGPSPVIEVSNTFQAAVTIPANGVTVDGLSTVTVGSNATFGFFVTGQRNLLRNNSASGHFVCFRENDGIDNTYLENTASGPGSGFADRGSSGIVYLNNHAIGSGNGFTSGQSRFFSVGSTYRGNVAVNCGAAGFELRGIRDSSLRDNVATGCGTGFNLTNAGTSGGSRNNSLRENEATGNSQSGFALQGGSNTNDLRQNYSADNGGYGYFVAELLSNVFKQNSCDNNALGGSNQPGICD